MRSGGKLHRREPRERGTLAAHIAEDPKDKAKKADLYTIYTKGKNQIAEVASTAYHSLLCMS